jgi:hypothetical protein
MSPDMGFCLKHIWMWISKLQFRLSKLIILKDSVGDTNFVCEFEAREHPH